MIIKKQLDDCMDNNVNVCIFYKCNKSYVFGHNSQYRRKIEKSVCFIWLWFHIGDIRIPKSMKSLK